MINLIPTAKVIFKDGHEEDSILVFMFSNKHYEVHTKSGAYMVDYYEPIKKYHPEYLTIEFSMNGDVKYNHSNCWLVDKSVKRIELDYCPFHK